MLVFCSFNITEILVQLIENWLWNLWAATTGDCQWCLWWRDSSSQLAIKLVIPWYAQFVNCKTKSLLNRLVILNKHRIPLRGSQDWFSSKFCEVLTGGLNHNTGSKSSSIAKQNNLLNDLVILNKQQILPKRLNKPFLRDPMKFLDCRTFCVRLHIDAAFAPRRQFVLQVFIRVIVYLHGWFVLRDSLPVSRDPYFNWLRLPITEPELGG